ncbi:MRG domain-containing protein, partial [Mycena leptocephala]
LAPTIVSGMREYFDRSLANHLLYHSERLQYAKVRAKYSAAGQKQEMSKVYGAERLLRMLVTMPKMVAQSTLDAESTKTLRDYTCTNELL